MKQENRFKGLSIFDILSLYRDDVVNEKFIEDKKLKFPDNFMNFYIAQIGYDIACKIDRDVMKKLN